MWLKYPVGRRLWTINTTLDTAMADVPVDVKSFAGKYIARATQMDALAAKKPETGAATVAFYCRRKALAAIMDNRDEAHLDKAEVAKFVGDLMTETERAKAALGISPATQEADKVSLEKRGADPRTFHNCHRTPHQALRPLLPSSEWTLHGILMPSVLDTLAG